MLDSSSLVLGGLSSNSADKTETAKKSLAQTYNQFLTLLTTQLKNQDPLNPMDSKDFTSQLIAMANTEQQIAQTDKMDQLLQLNQATAVNQALNYIGLDVNYVGDQFMHYDGFKTTFKYNVQDEGGIKGKVSILDKDNQVVWSSDAPFSAGEHTMTWDGKDNQGQPVPPGSYTLAVAVQNQAQAALKTTAVVPGLVTGIDTNADGQVLLIIGDQKVPISAVQSAFVAAPATAPQNG